MTGSNWLTRQTRRLGACRSELARPGDRVEGVLVLLAMIIALTAIPVALTVGTEVRAATIATADARRATLTPATAVLLARASTIPVGEAPPRATPAQAVWRLPDGSERTGVVAADPGTPAGSRVAIWLDQAGNPAAAPLSPSNALGVGVGVGVLVWTGVVALLCLLLCLVRFLLDRSRAASWAREWARIGSDLNRF